MEKSNVEATVTEVKEMDFKELDSVELNSKDFLAIQKEGDEGIYYFSTIDAAKDHLRGEMRDIDDDLPISNADGSNREEFTVRVGNLGDDYVCDDKGNIENVDSEYYGPDDEDLDYRGEVLNISVGNDKYSYPLEDGYRRFELLDNYDDSTGNPEILDVADSDIPYADIIGFNRGYYLKNDDGNLVEIGSDTGYGDGDDSCYNDNEVYLTNEGVHYYSEEGYLEYVAAECYDKDGDVVEFDEATADTELVPVGTGYNNKIYYKPTDDENLSEITSDVDRKEAKGQLAVAEKKETFSEQFFKNHPEPEADEQVQKGKGRRL